MSFSSSESNDSDRIRSAGGEASQDAFISCVARLENIIESETRILKGGGKVDFDVLNQRKMHALLEFLQVSRNASSGSMTRAAERIKTLQKLLAENAELLDRLLQATQEITTLIVHHIRESESDGTYSMRSPRMHPK